MEATTEDASFSREADAEEVNNGSYRSEDEPDEEGQENKEENVMEEEQEPPIIEPQEQVHMGSNTEFADVSNTETQFQESLSTRNSEADEIRKLNERLSKTIQSLTRQNHSLMMTVKTFQEKESEKIEIMLEVDKKHITDINNLTNENSKLVQKIKNLETSLKLEQKMKTEAEKTVKEILNDNEACSAQNPILEETIKRLEEKVFFLKEITLKTHAQSSLEKTEIINGDHVDGFVIDLEKISGSVRSKIIKIEEEYSSKVEQLKKTVTEKDRELINAQQQCQNYSFQNSNYESEIKALKSTIEALNVQIKEMKNQHLHTFSESQIKIKSLEEKVQAMENTTMSQDQPDGSQRRIELEMEILAYSNLVGTLESRIESTSKGKSKEGDNGKGSKESSGTTNQNPDSALVGQTESDPEADSGDNNQGQGGSPGTVGDNRGWNGTKDWSEHFKERQNLQNPDSALVGQTESDPEADNEEDNQGRKDNDGDDSDENNSIEIPLHTVEVPRDAIPRRQPRFAFRGTRSEFFEQ